MPRPERPLDPQNPAHMFALELRKLREEHGNPKYLVMARRAGDVSRTALSEAAGGDHLPTWRTVEAFVRACGADPQPWRPRWERAREAMENAPAEEPGVQPIAAEPGLVTAADLPGPPSTPLRRTITRAQAIVLTATAFVVGAALGFLLDQPPAPSTANPGSAGPTAIVVDNKVAVGPDELAEDTTPAYLSSQPRAYCRRFGCRIDGTDMSSGAVLVATCQTTGAWMTNYNLDTDANRNNPHRVDSTRWYRLELPDGRAGYLSEVYVQPEYRGGLNLPTCSPGTSISTPAPAQT